MYEQLTRLPLFQGATKEQIVDIIERLPLHFVKLNAGDKATGRGERCEHVRFIVSGSVNVTQPGDNDTLRYRLDAPDVLGPECLFGINPHYPFDATAGSDGCGLLLLAKRDFLTMLESNRIFMFNILNMLSTMAQRGAVPPASAVNISIDNHNISPSSQP